MSTQKPYWADAVYLEELQSLLKTMESSSWNTLRRNYGKGVGNYQNYDEYLSEVNDIKRAIQKIALEIKVFAEMDVNNRKFNKLIQSLKK